MRGQLAQVERGPRGQVRHRGQAVDRRARRAETDRQKHSVSVDVGAVDAQPARPDETALALVEVDAVGVGDRPVRAGADPIDDTVLAVHDSRQVHGRRARQLHPELAGPAHLLSHRRGRDHRLGGNAAPVQTGATKLVAFDERHPTVPAGTKRQRQPRHPSAHDKRVITLHHADHPIRQASQRSVPITSHSTTSAAPDGQQLTPHDPRHTFHESRQAGPPVTPG